MKLQPLLPQALRSLKTLSPILLSPQSQLSELLLQQRLLVGIILRILAPVCCGLQNS